LTLLKECPAPRALISGPPRWRIWDWCSDGFADQISAELRGCSPARPDHVAKIIGRGVDDLDTHAAFDRRDDRGGRDLTDRRLLASVLRSVVPPPSPETISSMSSPACLNRPRLSATTRAGPSPGAILGDRDLVSGEATRYRGKRGESRDGEREPAGREAREAAFIIGKL